MSLTQFAMVEELACLIKDNLPCKHLVLSTEEALIDFLKDDTSSYGVLELEPMNSYNRLLLHRLADIFGVDTKNYSDLLSYCARFSHQSVGEGDDRHLVFERCPETSVPSILVSDLLWQYDEIQSPSMSHLLVSRRPETSPELKTGRPTCQISLEEREAAYLAARERIFSMEEEVGPAKQKPRSNLVVARRMIAHALGQRIEPPPPRLLTGEEKDEEDLSLETYDYQQQTNILVSSENLTTNSINNNSSSCGKQKVSVPQNQGAAGEKGKNEISGGSVRKDNTKEQHIGAAKRMFANALGFHSTRRDMKQQTTNRGSSE